MAISVGVALGTVLAMAFAGAVLAAPVHNPAAAHLDVTPASGTTEQYAFGGNASVSWSCDSPATCFGSANATGFSSVSLSISYSVTWAVIYTQTNVSATQTTEEIQAGVGATASLSLSECYTDNASPCQTVSASVNLNGKEYGVGFTNVTPTGSVYLTPASGTPGNVAADAITNASSSELYNFSGNYNINMPSSGSNPAINEAVNFDFGGHENSGIAFDTPLGLVPLNPQPGDSWSSNASYSAHGGFTSGYSLTVTAYGRTVSNGTWGSGFVTPSGQLFENGTDLGAFTLYDNYTTPPQEVTAQEILISFSQGDNFSAADGWVLIPVGLFGSFSSLLDHPINGLHPALSRDLGIGTITSGETAYYEQNKGFVGAAVVSGSNSLPIGVGNANGPSVKLTAGPEPVSVAQGQYSGIVSGSSSSAGFPWTWLIVGVVVIILVVIVVAMVVMRGRRRPPTPTAPNAMMGSVGGMPPQAPPPPPPLAPGNP
jgi:hypothetical protein